MKKMMMRLHLDDLQVDSFTTTGHSPAIRGTIHANADLDTAGECMV